VNSDPSLSYRPGAPKIDLQDVLPSTAKTQSPPASTTAGSSSSDPTEKKLSRLRKKLIQIEALKLKLEKGVKLETTQV
jgi:hypothetical protein